MSGVTLQEAIDHISSTHELFALTEREIRGVTYKTFRNGPQHVRDLLDWSLQHGDADFLVYENERYTFAQVHRNTLRLASALVTEYGVKPGDRVALLMRNCPEYPMLFTAIACAGAVPVFLNSWWTSQELEYGFTDSEAKLAFADEPRAANMEPFAERMGIRRVTVRTSDMEKVREFWDLVDEDPKVAPPDVHIDPDSDFAVLYTSGTSGYPKGVVLTHRGAAATVHQWVFSMHVSDLLGYSPAPTIDANGKPYQPCTMVTTPFFHISATHAGFLLSLWLGLKLVMLHKWDPRRAVEIIDREKVSRFACVPTMSAELLEAAKEMGSSLASLRTIDSGGAKRPAAQVDDITRQVPHAMPGNGWGMTETGGPGIGMRGPLYLENPDATGRLQPPLLEMRIVDENDNEVATGEVGELLIKGVSNMRCYLNKPEETAKALRDGWLYTGDLAKVDAEGMVTIVDRKKDMIIRGGENISCAEVSAVLQLHPAVVEAVVFPVPDKRLGEDVGACVYMKPGSEVGKDELRGFLEAHLAPYKIPQRIWFQDTPLPRGATEKIDRLAIRAKYVEQ